MRSLHCSLAASAVALVMTICSGSAAELRDSPPIDSRQVLDMVEKLRLQQEASLKQRKTNALDMVKGASASGEKAVALWKEAVKHIQYDGASDGADKLRTWREGDGEALNSKEAQTAARLHMMWLYYTLQFHSGVKKKDLLPYVIDYTNQLAADGQSMENFEAQLEKEKDRKPKQGKGNEDATVKRVHDSILRTPVSATPLAKYLGLDVVLPRGAGQNERTAKKVAALLGTAATPNVADDTWPMTPGDLEGIHQALILPEFRVTKDPRILEYWERVIRRESENGGKKRTDFEERQFNEIRRPELFWSRAQDIMALGLKNRAIAEMVAVVKSNPLHPNLDQWLSNLEGAVTAAASSSASGVPAASPAAAGGTKLAPPVVK